MIPEYNAETQTLTVDNQAFAVTSRKRVKGYEFFYLADERRIITNGNIFFFTPTSSYGARQLALYESRPPIPPHLLPITEDTLISSLDEGIAMYFGITGSCASGLNMWVENFKKKPLPFPVPIKLLVRLTRGKYGSDILAEYLKPTGKRLFFGSQNKDGSIIPHPSQTQISLEEEYAIAAQERS